MEERPKHKPVLLLFLPVFKRHICSIQIAFSFEQEQHIVQCLANPG